MPPSCNRCSQICYLTPGMRFRPVARLGFPPFLPRITHLLLKCPIAEWESLPKTSPRFTIRSIQLKELGEEPGSVSPFHTGLCRSIRVILALKVIRGVVRLEEHTSELQSPCNLVCRLLLEKKNKNS